MGLKSLGAPLEGMRVIEMGSLIAGPFCGQVLGDFGAEVIKLEDPKAGDPMRQWGRTKPKGHSPWWPVIGRNKKSVTLDLRTPEGRGIARALIDTADVVVENFRPGTLEKWGMGYADLAKTNPGLVMARVSGFGQTGPYSHRAGYALIGEAMGGLRHITGEPDRPPARAGISIGDSLAGLNAALGVMMAIHARHGSGKGQVVDAAIYESVLTVMENLITEYDLSGYVRERSGAVLPGIAPSNVYPTRSGELILIGANQDTLFKRLCDAMGRPELATDERYRDHAARGVNQIQLDATIGGWTVEHDIEALLPLLEDAGLAVGRVYRAPDMLKDPQFIARESIVEVAHPVFGTVKMQNAFPRLSDTPGGVRWPGPALGEHSDAVLRDVAGLSGEAIAGLRAKGGGVMAAPYTGGCLCGALRYAARGEPLYMGHCYCADCRKASGSGFIPFMAFAAQDLTFSSATTTFVCTSARGSDAVRNSCPTCASLVFGGPIGQTDSHTIYAGSLDDPSLFRPTMAIFTRGRPDWAVVPEGLTQFEGLPD